MDRPEPLICFRHVSKSFEGPPIIDGLDLEISRGSTTVILGPSGAGKSVTLKLMVGLLRPDRGEITFDGMPLNDLKESELIDIRRRIGFLFQQGALFDSLTVLENIAFPMREHTNLDDTERRKQALEVLSMLGIPELIDRLPAELSGGQRKRVALARAIVLKPECLMYDEPTTGLDPIRSDVVAKRIQMLQQTLQPTSIVVTHDIPLAFKVADRMLLLNRGSVHFEGTPSDFENSQDPIVRNFLDGNAMDEDLLMTDGSAA